MFTAKSLTKSLVPVLGLAAMALGANAHAQVINYTSVITLTNPTNNGVTVAANGGSDTNVNAFGLGTSDVVGGFTTTAAPAGPAYTPYTSAFTDVLTIFDQASATSQSLTITGNLSYSANSTQVLPGSTVITITPTVYTLSFPVNRYFVSLNRFDDVAPVGSQNPGSLSYRFSTVAVPEPGAVAMMVGMGITGAGFLGRRRRK